MLNPSPQQEAQWQNDLLNCLARYLLHKKEPDQIRIWLSVKPEEYQADMRKRLNQQRPIVNQQKREKARQWHREAAKEDC